MNSKENGINPNKQILDSLLEKIYSSSFNIKNIEDTAMYLHDFFIEGKIFDIIWTGIWNLEQQSFHLCAFFDNFNYHFNDFEDLLKKNLNILHFKNPFLIFNNNISSLDIENCYSRIFKEHLLRKNIYSYALFSIIYSENKLLLISFFSSKINFFSEEIVEKLKEFQNNFQFLIDFPENKQLYKYFIYIFEKLNIWFMITDENGIIEYVNPYIEKLTLYSKEELIGKKSNIFKSNLQPIEFYKNLWNTIKYKNDSFSGNFINKDKNGNLFYLKQEIIPFVLFKNNKKFLSIGIPSQKNLLENYIKETEFFDPLTKLPNQSIFIKYLKERIENIQNTNKKILCIVLDIENYTYLNTFLNKETLDQILFEFSQILLKHMFSIENSFLAKIGTDKFGIIIEIPENIQNLEDHYQNIFYNITKFVKVQGYDFYVNFKAGISCYPEDSVEPEKLFLFAQSAQKKCKTETAKFYEFFSLNIEKISQIHIFIQQQKEFFNMDKNDFYPVFQPYYDLKSHKISGVEILSRWNHFLLGNVSPVDFIPILEKSGIIKRYELSLLKYFLYIYKKHIEIKTNLQNIKFSFNLSSISFTDPFFLDYFINLYKEESIKPKLILELSESSYIKNMEYAIPKILELKKLGFLISIDDFGTGYSSFKYIMDLDIDYLKIDKSYIQNYKNKKSFIIIETINSLAKRLNIKTIAEGVESEEELKVMKLLRIDYVQGFLFSKPLLWEEFILQI